MRITPVLVAGALFASPVEAQITRIIIESVVSPAFGGASYGTAGQYGERLSRRAGVQLCRE